MVKEKIFVTARNDIVFKTVFIDDNDHRLMNALLSEILDTDVKIIKYLKNDLDIKDTDEREKRVDALIEADGKKIHLELNTGSSLSVRYRNLIYFEAWHSNETRKSEKYDASEEYIHIDLTFGMNKKELPINVYMIRSIIDKEVYVKNIKFYVVNMDKIKEFWYSKDRKGINRFKYLMMIDLPKDDLDNYAQDGDEIINDYKEKVMDVNEKFSFRDFIPPEEDERRLREAEKEEFRREGLEEGRQEGIELGKQEGIKEGIKEGKKEVINNLYNSGVDINTIAIGVNMSIEEVNKIISEL